MSVIILQGGTTRVSTQAADIQTLTNLGNLHDVTVSGVLDGQIIAYDLSSGEWINVDPGDVEVTEVDGGSY